MSNPKKTYEKPVIIKIQSTMSKAGLPSMQQRIRKDIDGVPISTLTKNYGSPLFVFSEKKMRSQYQEAYKAFSSRYPNIQFGWSYKTNYLKAVCAVFHQEGAIAEVVSELEYEKARHLGVEGKDIIFNGPYKPYTALKTAVTEGAKIHIDNFDEISDLEKISDELGMKVPVAIRVNMNTGMQQQWSRFGFNIESGQAMDAVRRIEAGGKLLINGIHSHIGTFILDANAYKIQTTKMALLMKEIEKHTDFIIEYLDVGGGFASKAHLRGIYQPPEVVVPNIEDYAEAITSALYDTLEYGNYPKLYLETGRYLVDEAGYLITSLTGSKRLPDGRMNYIMDAGVNLLYTALWFKYNLELGEKRDGMMEPALVNGPLCMNIDIIDESVMLPRLKRDDKMIISPVGAYSITQWMQFIRYRPAIVLIDMTGQTHLVREAEELKDLEDRERLPEHLKE